MSAKGGYSHIPRDARWTWCGAPVRKDGCNNVRETCPQCLRVKGRAGK